MQDFLEFYFNILEFAPVIYIHVEAGASRVALLRRYFEAVYGDYASVRLDAHLVGDIEIESDNLAVFQHHFESYGEIIASA